MPTPTASQTRDEFIAICVPQVLAEGTAQNPQQAVAICISMYEQAKKAQHESTQSE